MIKKSDLLKIMSWIVSTKIKEDNIEEKVSAAGAEYNSNMTLNCVHIPEKIKNSALHSHQELKEPSFSPSFLVVFLVHSNE